MGNVSPFEQLMLGSQLPKNIGMFAQNTLLKVTPLGHTTHTSAMIQLAFDKCNI